jgi:hypothetical protein
VLLAVVGAPLALVSCGDEQRPTSPQAAPGPAPAPAPGPEDDAAPAFRTAAECGKCHEEIHAEWEASQHGRAMDDPLFLDLSASVNKEECIRCHAPVPLRESDFLTPIARAELRDDAITCLSCHQSGSHVTGPFEGLSGACRPVYDPDQRDVVKMCFGCHNQHDTGNEWLAGPYAPDAPEPRVKEARTCLDCHMPEVERPLVKGGPVRKGRRHTWPGGHSMEQLRKAPALDVQVEPLAGGGHRFRVFVTNAGAGHWMPTDARHRSMDVYVKLWDGDGNVILDPLDPRQQSRAQTAKYRKNYRGSGLEDTQIPPLQRVSGLGKWPGHVDVPEAEAGRGEAWLVYRLTPSDTLTAESLVDGPLVLYRARLVTKVEFAFGEAGKR